MVIVDVVTHVYKSILMFVGQNSFLYVNFERYQECWSFD